MSNLAARFWLKVNKNGPLMPGMPTRCWEWTASTRRDGYGQLSEGKHNGKTIAAHRLSWFLKHGKWPTPCCLHKCDYRRCVRPSHLSEGTKRDNQQDMSAKGRSVRGERQPFSKLTESTVAIIRKKYGTKKYTQQHLAKTYKIDPSWVSRVVTKKCWRHVS